MEQYVAKVRGHAVAFYSYVDSPGFMSKVRQLERFFERLPDRHLAALYPIFAMENKPGGRAGGGTWRPDEVRSNFSRPGHERNTGIPFSEFERLVLPYNQGVIGLSRDRWERPMGRLEFTVMHEVGHCIDSAFGPSGLLPRRVREADFEGMATNRCGAGGAMTRRAVEAYARMICRPSRVFHNRPLRESAAHANERLIGALRRSPAFRDVPEAWMPTGN